jgi:sporulation protein YlmC with PRC-barrel domain
MSQPRYVDLARGILDHQILDSEGRRCGNVDDLELDLTPGGPAEAVALLVGPRYWPSRIRGPIGRLVARMGGNKGQKIPWSEVESVTSAIVLKRRAEELGLGRGDDRARKWVEWMPGADA